MSEEHIEEYDQNVIDAESVQVNVVCNRSERFRNIVVSIAVLGCLLVTGLNTLVTRFNSRATAETFSTLSHEAAQAQQIMVAQDYAMQVGQIAEYEASRAHELEQKMDVVVQQQVELMKAYENLKFQHSMNQMSISLQGSYINQLIEFIEAHDLPVPAPDMKDRSPRPAQGDQGRAAPDIDESGPVITIEVIDEDGNVVDQQRLVPEDSETPDDDGN